MVGGGELKCHIFQVALPASRVSSCASITTVSKPTRHPKPLDFSQPDPSTL